MTVMGIVFDSSSDGWQKFQVFDQMTCEREIISQVQNILFNTLFIHLMKF